MGWLLEAAAKSLGRAPETLHIADSFASGQALAVRRIVCDLDHASWIAKDIHPSLTREIHAYQHGLRGKKWAPVLLHILKDPHGNRCLLMEDRGEPIGIAGVQTHLDSLSDLAVSIHLEGNIGWWPHIRWPRPVYIRHGFRFLRGEFRIALVRLARAARQGYIQEGLAPTDAEATVILQAAWEALNLCELSFIHGDLDSKNILIDNTGSLTAVDYSQWGEGRWLWDLASLARCLPPPLRRTLLEKYLQERGRRRRDPGNKPWLEALEAVCVLRLLITWGALAHHVCPGNRINQDLEAFQEQTQAWENHRQTAYVSG